METFYVYVIVSIKDGRFYFGQTNDLDKRIAHHNAGYSKYTAKYIPWEIFAFKTVATRAVAMKIEKQLKNCKGKLRVMHFLDIHSFHLVIGPEK